MCRARKSFLIRMIAIVMALVFIMPVSAAATVPETAQPYASSYLSGYGAYVYLPGTGEVRVYFNVEGTRYMDELGVLFIDIYESEDQTSWKCVKTFNHYSTSGMLSYNDDYHSGYVSYNGIAGRYYKAYVCVWGGKDGQGDARYFWTGVKH